MLICLLNVILFQEPREEALSQVMRIVWPIEPRRRM
jgi:hypothetical protein